MPDNNFKDEYKDLSDNMRHYANMRFALLTIFVGITGALFALLFRDKNPLSCQSVGMIFKMAGIFIAVLFFVMQERAADYWHHFRRRAVELEDLLGYRQYKDRPTRTLLTATNASRALHVGAMLFWVMAMLWKGSLSGC